MTSHITALITGASKGIGRAIAIKFAAEGLQVALTARTKSGLEETAETIRQQGGKPAILIQADLKKPDDVVRIAETAVKESGQIDLLVNNAGVMHLKPFTELSLEEYQEMMDVNMRAPFLLTQAVVKLMIKQGNGGTIINIASLAGKNGFKTGTGYAATKWALRGFANCLLQEVRENDIRVVTIFPGSVDTELSRGGTSPTGTLPRNKMQPEDIAEAAWMAVKMPRRTMVSEIDLRPSNPKK